MQRMIALLFFLSLASCGGTGTGADGGCPAAPDASPAPASATLEYLEACEMHEQCKTGLCFLYASRGVSLCTHPCTDACQCATPSSGCSGMGVCKAP